MILKRIGAAILLALLIFLPFIHWRAGATLWLCVGITYICGQVLGGLAGHDDDQNPR